MKYFITFLLLCVSYLFLLFINYPQRSYLLVVLLISIVCCLYSWTTAFLKGKTHFFQRSFDYGILALNTISTVVASWSYYKTGSILALNFALLFAVILLSIIIMIVRIKTKAP